MKWRSLSFPVKFQSQASISHLFHSSGMLLPPYLFPNGECDMPCSSRVPLSVPSGQVPSGCLFPAPRCLCALTPMTDKGRTPTDRQRPRLERVPVRTPQAYSQILCLLTKRLSGSSLFFPQGNCPLPSLGLLVNVVCLSRRISAFSGRIEVRPNQAGPARSLLRRAGGRATSRSTAMT